MLRGSSQPAVPVFGLAEEKYIFKCIFPSTGLVLNDEEMNSLLHSVKSVIRRRHCKRHLAGINIGDELGGHFRTVSRPCAALFDVLTH